MNVYKVICTSNGRRQLTPNFGRISISENSTIFRTTFRGSNICRILRNGDSSKIRGELPTADVQRIQHHNSWLKHWTNLCSPNDDFYSLNERLGTYLLTWTTLQAIVAQTSCEQRRSQTFVRTVEIFVWGASNSSKCRKGLGNRAATKQLHDFAATPK